jgi:hypothetical protein
VNTKPSTQPHGCLLTIGCTLQGMQTLPSVRPCNVAFWLWLVVGCGSMAIDDVQLPRSIQRCRSKTGEVLVISAVPDVRFQRRRRRWFSHDINHLVCSYGLSLSNLLVQYILRDQVFVVVRGIRCPIESAGNEVEVDGTAICPLLHPPCCMLRLCFMARTSPHFIALASAGLAWSSR